MSASLVFGSVELTGDPASSGPYTIEALGDGTDWGNPEPITQTVESWLADGAVIATTGYGNRTLTVGLLITAGTAAGLAAAESALVAECRKANQSGSQNTLTWSPPDGYGVPCVFDIVAAKLDHAFNDLDEVRSQPQRTYTLTLTALPFARPADQVSETVVIHDTTPTTETLVDACTSTTGWTGYPNTAAYDAGYGHGGFRSIPGLYEYYVGPWYSGLYARLTRTGLSVTAKRYLKLLTTHIDPWYGTLTPSGDPAGYDGGTAWVSVNGSSALVYAGALSTVDGTYDYFEIPAGITTITSVMVSDGWVPDFHGSVFTNLSVGHISTTDALPSFGSGRQRLFTADVTGSERTPASLNVFSAGGTALGSVLVHTTPAVGAAQSGPDLRRYLSSGNTQTGDAAMVSGATSDLATPHTFDLPAGGFDPGAHLLIVKGGTAWTWSAKTLMGSTAIDEGQGGSATGTGITALGLVTLPNRQMGSLGKVRITLSGTGTLDEAWLFNIESGALTWVECGTGTPAPGGDSARVWLDSADLGQLTPSISLGTAADRSDAIGAHGPPQTQSFGGHEFAPPAVNVFVVTTNTTDASINLTHYPRWHSHVA